MMEYYWDYVTDSEPIIIFAFWLGVAVFLMTIFMLGVILVMRQLVLHREKNHRAAMNYWKNIITNPDTDISHILHLPTHQLSGFLEIWNNSHEPLHGQTTPALATLAKQIDLENHLYTLIKKGNFHERIASIIGLGHIKDSDSFDVIAAYIDDNSPLISLCAARALTQTDPKRAASLLVPQIVRRVDWSPGRVATILQEAGPHYASKELSQAILRAHVDVVPRLMRFLSGVSPEEAAPLIRQILMASHDEKLMSTCLQVMSDPADLEHVRALTLHARWHIRMQAAVTLGRLGTHGDEKLLIDMLKDSQWWVRYRAAQSLMVLPFIDAATLERIRNEQTDQYARDILNQVMAEKNMEVEP